MESCSQPYAAGGHRRFPPAPAPEGLPRIDHNQRHHPVHGYYTVRRGEEKSRVFGQFGPPSGVVGENYARYAPRLLLTFFTSLDTADVH